MKKLQMLFLLLIVVSVSRAQKVDYKNNTITVDGKEIAKVNRIKDAGNFGLTATYELLSMTGKKLIIATIATDYDPNSNDSFTNYYRFTFLTADQLGVFSLSKLGPEKSFAKLIGSSGIITNDDLDPAKVKEFIALKGRSPRITADYTIVNRSRMWPIKVNDDGTITQDKQIGTYKDITTDAGSGIDTYEFALPIGLTVAKVSFTGGNNAQSFDVYTLKDSNRQIIRITPKDLIKFTTAGRTHFAIVRITQWLVDNNYL